MRRVFLAIAFILVASAGAFAQESEFSGGGSGGGGVSTAGGSGTADVIPKFVSASSISDSLLSSTTNVTLASGQFLVPNGTSAAPSYAFTNATGVGFSYSATLGTSGSGGVYFTKGNFVYSLFTNSEFWLGSSTALQFDNGSGNFTVADTGVKRSAAGTVRLTDGSTGYSVGQALQWDIPLYNATFQSNRITWGRADSYMAMNLDDATAANRLYMYDDDNTAKLAFRNGTNPEGVRVYNTWTSATNFERLNITWASNIVTLGTEKGSGGGTARVLSLATDGTARWNILATTGHLQPNADATYDIGDSTHKVNQLFLTKTLQGGATKTLTDASATNFVRVDIASGSNVGGYIVYTVTATNATPDYQTRSGYIPFAIVNKAGTETAALGTSSTAVAVSAGTLTETGFTADTSPTNGVNFAANFDSSLTTPTDVITYTVIITSGTATVTGL